MPRRGDLVNAVERLWRAIARNDYAAIAAQLQENARIEWPHTHESLSATEYVIRQRLAGDREVRVLRVLVDEERVAVHAEVDGRAVGAFYDLEESRIAIGVEIWA
jgi:SnoaL-like domain